MRTHLHLAAALLAATTVAAGAQVQDEAPTPLRTPTLNPHRWHRAEDLSWTWQYTAPAPAGRESALVADPRLRPLLTRTLKAPQSFWGDLAALPSTVDTAFAFLDVPGPVLGEDNRYITAEGSVRDFPTSRGQLFLDLNPARPLIVFSAVDWIRDSRSVDQPTAEYTLWIFPSRALDPDHIPPAFTHSITRWTSTAPAGRELLQNITHVILVDPDGAPHALTPGSVGAHNTLPLDPSDTKAHL